MLTSARVVGALSLGSDQCADNADLDLTQELATRCAVALDNARQYRLARQAVERRDMFVATVSHDLRNPLATIRGQAQLLRGLSNLDDATTGAQRLAQGIARIEASVERMSRMIDMLLDATRLELGGGLDLKRSPMGLLAVAQHLAAEHQQRAPRHRIQVAGDTSLVGHWDAARMERVVDNLIENAVKYSPDGGVITVNVFNVPPTSPGSAGAASGWRPSATSSSSTAALSPSTVKRARAARSHSVCRSADPM